MRIREIKELVKRGILWVIDGRPAYPHPWESNKPLDSNAIEAEKQLGGDTIQFPDIVATPEEERYFGVMGAVEHRPVRTCVHCGVFKTRDWSTFVHHHWVAHGIKLD